MYWISQRSRQRNKNKELLLTVDEVVLCVIGISRRERENREASNRSQSQE